MSETTVCVSTDPLYVIHTSHQSDTLIATPCNIENSPPRILDCSIRVQDILVSPSPICRRTRRQLQLRQTVNLQTAFDDLNNDIPLDLSPHRTPVTETPVSAPNIENTLESCTTPLSLKQIDLQMRNCAAELENEMRQQSPSYGKSPIPFLTPDEVQIIRNITVSESPISLFPSVLESAAVKEENVDKSGSHSEDSNKSPALQEGKTPPAIQIGVANSPIQIQQIEYFPFSLRCAFCDLELSSPSSFSEHILEIHSGCSESQIGVIQRRENQSPSPPSSGEKNPSDSALHS
ncbi:hypothetical protein AVEN_57914-1 [Araneus ventricosus]|uniref:C2H2-type domain-containing protein n=1 Tax=Araneus ventricosus TaxID=182803 RepID=A0A4Y2KIB5_ARAVE|nr:hypothetical protein AVEN_57914-1 [Araneus ventricosus]